MQINCNEAKQQILVANKALCRLMAITYWCAMCLLRLDIIVYISTSLTLLNLHPFIDSMYPNNERLFQQDNAVSLGPSFPELVLRSIMENSNKCCGHYICPGMCPIEHLWDMLERSIYMQDPDPTNINDLQAVIKTTWFNMNLQPLVEF